MTGEGGIGPRATDDEGVSATRWEERRLKPSSAGPGVRTSEEDMVLKSLRLTREERVRGRAGQQRHGDSQRDREGRARLLWRVRVDASLADDRELADES